MGDDEFMADAVEFVCRQTWPDGVTDGVDCGRGDSPCCADSVNSLFVVHVDTGESGLCLADVLWFHNVPWNLTVW